ncbi:hypothetical protein MCOR25_005118 [Pyricularia grisea]|uniref:Cytochrome P450 n=1 Tax=Pyricularia grisea TaxID=148305 RepID=A0A6P8BB95_PYRGI|nr:uncharacterized protein PgNI_05100 [Pyricularia grisea]KAI6366471.1 hypothetical protein MCOR25_005118 [Pyricularia grisea]TLD13100.1 hypothetical protein PgNI_05100 [Pyricularia grisea]
MSGSTADESFSPSLFTIIRDQTHKLTAINITVLTTAVLILTTTLLLHHLASRNPILDAHEPPEIQPRIPYLGHLLGAITSHTAYAHRIWTAHPTKPVVTFFLGPIKCYAIFHPNLQHTIIRSRAVKYDEYPPAAVPAGFGVDPRVMAVLNRPEFSGRYMHEASSMLGGATMRSMEKRAFAYLASQLNNLPHTTTTAESLYTWLRDTMSMATAEALFGARNPYRTRADGDEMSLIRDQWTFEGSLGRLLLSPTSAVARALAPAGCRARDRVHAALVGYYAAGDEVHGAAEMVQRRAGMLREAGLSAAEFGPHEITAMHGATSNTIPSLFWTVANVYLRPGLLEELRVELEGVVEVLEQDAVESKKRVRIKTADLESSCPLLANCVREALRLSSQWIGWRSTHANIEIPADRSPDGRPYLLKKGVQVIMPAGITHRAPSFWSTATAEEPESSKHGRDSGGVEDFNPHRFTAQSKHKIKSTKGGLGYMPFGGGPYLCPGRNFANDEILGFVSALVLGFDIVGLRQDKVKMRPARIFEVSAKPAKGGDGGRVEIQRRRDWEHVHFEFVFVE